MPWVCSAEAPRDDATTTEAADVSPEAETKRISEGYWCHVPEHDLRARVLAVRGGIAELEIAGASTEKKLEAPRIHGHPLHLKLKVKETI